RGDELDVMSHFCPLHRHTRASILRVIGVSAEDDDSQLAVIRPLRRSRLGESDLRTALANTYSDHDTQAARCKQRHSRESHSRFHFRLFPFTIDDIGLAARSTRQTSNNLQSFAGGKQAVVTCANSTEPRA